MRVTYPGGAAVQGIGIVPDVEVTITAEDKDEILEKSIDVVDTIYVNNFETPVLKN
jgi:C-terminal processing protease CtpA/Prc